MGRIEGWRAAPMPDSEEDGTPDDLAVDLRSGSWMWIADPAAGQGRGTVLRLSDPGDPRRRMEVHGLPRSGISAAEVPYFARRAEVRWIPAASGEFRFEMGPGGRRVPDPFGWRSGVKVRIVTPSGDVLEAEVGGGQRLGDLTDSELLAIAAKARRTLGIRRVINGLPTAIG